MLTLSVESAGDFPRTLQIEKLPCVIGRSSPADIVLGGWRVARDHARIEIDAAGLRIVDQGSLAGTQVNGERIVTFGPLTESDEIVIGGHQLRVLALPGLSRAISVGRPAPETPGLLNPLAHSEPVQVAGGTGSDRYVWRRLLHRRLLSQIDLQRQDIRMLSGTQLREQVGRTLEEVIRSESALPPDIDRTTLIREVLDEAVGLGPLEGLLADDTVSEIMVNGTAPIHVERSGKIEQTALAFSSDDAIRSVIDRIIAPLGRHVDEGSPMVDARLADGSRLNAVLPPLSLSGPAVTIRRFNRRLYMASDLVELGTLSAQMLAFLKLCVTSRRSIVVSGGTGAGKTTLLNLLSGFIGQDERVITIEDAAELRLDHRNLVSLEARPSNSEGRGLVSVRDLVKNALRMRPDRIVVGECRGGEALDMLQAMNTGHDGSLTTVHANSPRDALSRIEVMTLMSGVDIPLQAIREQIASAVHIVVQQARCPDGRRRVTDISEVTGIESGRILMQSLFRLQSTEGRVPRHLASGHIPQFLEGIPNARSAGLLDLFGSAA
jgi:pilus assembly protein CpaF